MAFCGGSICRNYRHYDWMVEFEARTTRSYQHFYFPVWVDLVGLCCFWSAGLERQILSETKRIPEYREGPEATENFERGMKALFQVPKAAVSKKKSKKPGTTLRKPKSSDKD
jgi:hypothetical protein